MQQRERRRRSWWKRSATAFPESQDNWHTSESFLLEPYFAASVEVIVHLGIERAWRRKERRERKASTIRSRGMMGTLACTTVASHMTWLWLHRRVQSRNTCRTAWKSRQISAIVRGEGQWMNDPPCFIQREAVESRLCRTTRQPNAPAHMPT